MTPTVFDRVMERRAGSARIPCENPDEIVLVPPGTMAQWPELEVNKVYGTKKVRPVFEQSTPWSELQ